MMKADLDRSDEDFARERRGDPPMERRCPKCGVGIDSDGDGDCAVCAIPGLTMTPPLNAEEPPSVGDMIRKMRTEWDFPIDIVLCSMTSAYGSEYDKFDACPFETDDLARDVITNIYYAVKRSRCNARGVIDMEGTPLTRASMAASLHGLGPSSAWWDGLA